MYICLIKVDEVGVIQRTHHHVIPSEDQAPPDLYDDAIFERYVVLNKNRFHFSQEDVF